MLAELSEKERDDTVMSKVKMGETVPEKQIRHRCMTNGKWGKRSRTKQYDIDSPNAKRAEFCQRRKRGETISGNQRLAATSEKIKREKKYIRFILFY
jgi:hypothetical protein